MTFETMDEALEAVLAAMFSDEPEEETEDTSIAEMTDDEFEEWIQSLRDSRKEMQEEDLAEEEMPANYLHFTCPCCGETVVYEMPIAELPCSEYETYSKPGEEN